VDLTSLVGLAFAPSGAGPKPLDLTCGGAGFASSRAGPKPLDLTSRPSWLWSFSFPRPASSSTHQHVLAEHGGERRVRPLSGASGPQARNCRIIRLASLTVARCFSLGAAARFCLQFGRSSRWMSYARLRKTGQLLDKTLVGEPGGDLKQVSKKPWALA